FPAGVEDARVQLALGQVRPLRPGRASTGAFGGRTGIGGVLVELGQQPGELVEGGDHGQLAAQLSPDRVPLEVPGDVLAQIANSVELVLELVDEVRTVLVHGPAHLGQSRTVALLAAVQRVREVAEEPGPSLAAATDDDSVAAGRGHHLQSVLGGEDIAVAQY